METHVQHAVGFVEDQRGQCVELQAAAFHVVHDPAGGADDDMHAVFQTGHLIAQRRAATQRQHLDVFLEAGQAADFLGHLIGQFARRAQHQRLDREQLRVQFGQQWQSEGCSLAATGLGLGDQVVAGQRQRQAGGLDGRHLQVG
jgi:hypothetical protein